MDDSFHVTVSSLEQRIIINALNKIKEHQIKNGKDYTAIDDIIIKVCDARPTKEKGHRKRYFEER